MALYKYHYIELDTKRSPRISLQNIVAGETGNRLWITVTNNGETIDMSEKDDGEYIYRVCLAIKSNLGVRRQDSAVPGSGITIIDDDTGYHGMVNIRLSADSFTVGKNRCRLEIYSKQWTADDTLICSAEWTFDAAGNPTGENTGEVYPLMAYWEKQCKSWAVGGTGKRNGEDVDNAKYYKMLAEEAVEQGVISPSVTAWMDDNESFTQPIIESKVGEWLDANPEATTTVQDGAVTRAKLSTSLIDTIFADTTHEQAFNTTAGTAMSANTKIMTGLNISSGTRYTVEVEAPTGTFGSMFIYKFNGDTRTSLKNSASINTEYEFTATETVTALSIYATAANVLLSSACKIVVKIPKKNPDSIEAKVNDASNNIDVINSKITVLPTLMYDKIKGRFVCHIGATYNTFDTIPSQSIFDIERAARLGYNAIELNVLSTSDGKFICTHGSGNKFGNAFTSLDESDISDTLVNSVTLDYIKTNVRYKSTLDKYKVAPPTLEEALIACHKHGILPAIQNVSGVTDIADKIIGKDNYILNIYTSNRPSGYTGICASWLTIADEDDLLAKCEASGGAYIAGLNVSNAAYSGFDADDWKSMFSLLHENGYRVMTSYVNNPSLMHTLVTAGLDYIFSLYQVPDVLNGNVCNLTDDVTWDDFTTTGTVSGNAVTLASGQTIRPSDTYDSVFLGCGALHMRFNGSIYVTFGHYVNHSCTITSDGTEDVFLSTYFDRERPTFTITATGSTTFYNLTYKASEV